jgi:GDP-mannose 6-dehydrogenase
MKVSVIGLGYVGCVSAACLAQAEHEVIGVDVSELKVSMINDGHSPIIEPGISELLLQAKENKRLSARQILWLL